MDASVDIRELMAAFPAIHEGADLDLELDTELLGPNGIAALRRAFEKAYRSLFPDESLEIYSMKRMFKYERDMVFIGLRKKLEP